MIAKSAMTVPCRWVMLLISVWIQMGFVPGIQCKHGTENHLSREEVLLFKYEEDPKCFTRTGRDFTCFFETADNLTYDLVYTSDSLHREKMCFQRPEEGTFLHICSFTSGDVYMYVPIEFRVVEHNTNTTLYNRTVSLEDHFLLEPSDYVSLRQNGHVGQLQVSWQIEAPHYCADVMHRFRYSSPGLGQKTTATKETKYSNTHTRTEKLDSLVPGQETEVQVAVRCGPDLNAGHWSSWSHPVRAIVPQSADDVSLICYTSDLQNIICQWNGSRYGVEKEYKLFYKIGVR